MTAAATAQHIAFGWLGIVGFVIVSSVILCRREAMKCFPRNDEDGRRPGFLMHNEGELNRSPT
jgi:hypothetical protein